MAQGKVGHCGGCRNAERKAVSLEETLPYPQIYFAKGSGIRNVVDRLFEDIEAKPQISCENEEDQVIAGLVAGGFGIAVVPYMDMLMKLDISILEIEYPPYRREFFMVQNNDAYFKIRSLKSSGSVFFE